MTPELEEFLAAEDLSALRIARRRITAPDAEDVATIRSVLAEWRKPQAVANLLFHPTLVPKEIRPACLFRGLAEQRVAYHVLAAVVGFQTLDPAEVSAENRKRVAGELLALVRRTKGILAQRASVSLPRWISAEDAPHVLALWAHPDDTVWHNLRAWLFRTFQTRGTESFAAAARQSGLSAEAQRRLCKDFTEFMAEPEDFDSWLAELYGCIPNLRDVAHSA